MKKTDICECYYTTTKHIVDYDWYDSHAIGGYDKIVGHCNGTKEGEECSCGGDVSKCDFYPEKRTSKKEYHITSNREWLNSLSNEELADWFLGKLKDHTKIGDYNVDYNIGLPYLVKSFSSTREGLIRWLKADVYNSFYKGNNIEE